jgi:hypothetical protein
VCASGALHCVEAEHCLHPTPQFFLTATRRTRRWWTGTPDTGAQSSNATIFQAFRARHSPQSRHAPRPIPGAAAEGWDSARAGTGRRQCSGTLATAGCLDCDVIHGREESCFGLLEWRCEVRGTNSARHWVGRGWRNGDSCSGKCRHCWGIKDDWGRRVHASAV